MLNFQQVSRAMRVSRSALELPPRDFKYVASKSNIRWGNGEPGSIYGGICELLWGKWGFTETTGADLCNK
jgi:hypothetical protein